MLVPIQPGPPKGSLLRFGESIQRKFERECRQLETERYFERLSPEAEKNSRKLIEATRQNLAFPASQIFMTLKQNGGSAIGVFDRQGFIPAADTCKSLEVPYGFFLEDTQYLDRFAIRSSDKAPLRLEQSDIRPEAARFEYVMEKYPLSIRRQDTVQDRSLEQQLTFTNRGDQPKEITLLYGARGQDLFAVRSAKHPPGLKIEHEKVNISEKEALFTTKTSRIPDKAAESTQPQFEENRLQREMFEKQPQNSLRTRIRLLSTNLKNARFEPVQGDDRTSVVLKVKLQPGETGTVTLQVQPENALRPNQPVQSDMLRAESAALQMPKIEVSTAKGFHHLARVWKTAKEDIRQLLIPVQCGEKSYLVPAAGSPRFIAFFGRDSVITALQTLDFNPGLAKNTLRAIAYHQGKSKNAFREEGSGKALHELRLGEWSRLGFTPHSPYYGTIDTTPLFVILFHNYMERTNDSRLMQELWPNLERALDWINRNVDDPANPLRGFLAQRLAKQENKGISRLKNIGWKDSGDSMQHLVGSDGKLYDPEYPLALAEVQAYVYGAWNAAAALYERQARLVKGDSEGRRVLLEKAHRYAEKAKELKARFNREFWMEDKQFIATALQGNGQQLKSISSNGGQCLWTGIVNEDKARKVADRLMQPDMLSGWGVRTLSSQEKAFFPFSYQNGAVWPHDNSLIVAGLKRYGFADKALRITNQVLDASRTFAPDNRLPELYVGFQRKKGDRTLPAYPETCTPQAWASATPFSLLSSMLGLQIDREKRQVLFHQPMLPRGMNSLIITGLQVSPKEFVDLHIHRKDGSTTPQINMTTSPQSGIQLAVSRDGNIPAIAVHGKTAKEKAS